MNTEPSNTVQRFIPRLIDYIRHYRVIAVPLIVVLLIWLLYWTLAEKREDPSYVANQIIVAGDPDVIDEVIQRALPGAIRLSSIESVKSSDCDCDLELEPIETREPPLEDAESATTTLEGTTSTPLPPAVEESIDDPFEHPLNFAIQLLDVSSVVYAEESRDGAKSGGSTSVDNTVRAIGEVYEAVNSINGKPGAIPAALVADPNYIVTSSKKTMDPNDGPGGIGARFRRNTQDFEASCPIRFRHQRHRNADRHFH